MAPPVGLSRQMTVTSVLLEYNSPVYNPDKNFASLKKTQKLGTCFYKHLHDFRLWTKTRKFLTTKLLVCYLVLNRLNHVINFPGIHGAPFIQWDKVTGDKSQGMMGYCPHASNLFGTWHRPYLALFEQILHDRAVDIANEYPEGEARDNAMKIAHKVRLPYWDWAMDPPDTKEGVIPYSLRRPTATVICPNGTKYEIANPLRRYDFHPLKYDDFSALVPIFPNLWLRYSTTDMTTERISIQKLESYHPISTRWLRFECYQSQ